MKECPMNEKKRTGRPKKAEHEKITYQRIAVYSADYEKLAAELSKRNIRLTDAFSQMVAKYIQS